MPTPPPLPLASIEAHNRLAVKAWNLAGKSRQGSGIACPIDGAELLNAYQPEGDSRAYWDGPPERHVECPGCGFQTNVLVIVPPTSDGD